MPYLRAILGFLGMTDVRVLYAERLAMGPQALAPSMDEARADIRAWASGEAPAADGARAPALS